MAVDVAPVSVTTVASTRSLFASTRMWQERAGANWVLFAPDRRGLPVVANPAVIEILDLFRTGNSIQEAIRVVRDSPDSRLDVEQADRIITFLVERSFLREQPDPSRYEARDASAYKPETFSIWLHINNHCNLDCAYCFVDKSQAEMS